jgi:hypothetical protein
VAEERAQGTMTTETGVDDWIGWDFVTCWKLAHDAMLSREDCLDRTTIRGI